MSSVLRGRFSRVPNTLYENCTRGLCRLRQFWKSLQVDNWPSFLAAVLGFFGTVVIVMDSFGCVHQRIDRLEPFVSLNAAVRQLETRDTELSDGLKVGLVETGDRGFPQLIQVIEEKDASLSGREIRAVLTISLMDMAGVDMPVVHLGFAETSETEPLTSKYILDDWVREYRERFFLAKGLWLIGIGFASAVLGQVKRKWDGA